MYKLLIVTFLLNCFYSVSQLDSYKENSWGGILWRHTVNSNLNFSIDAGHRTFDNFTRRKRQDLVRVFIERKLSPKNSIGIGVAYFESIKQNSDLYLSEFRPFIQYQFLRNNEKNVIGFRFRNEVRYYIDSKKFVNRSRVQLSYELKTSKKQFSPRIAIEGFVSALKTPIVEQRFSLGNTFIISKVIHLFAFYTLQFQSNIKENNRQVAQNIFGILLTVNTKNNDN